MCDDYEDFSAWWAAIPLALHAKVDALGVDRQVKVVLRALAETVSRFFAYWAGAFLGARAYVEDYIGAVLAGVLDFVSLQLENVIQHGRFLQQYQPGTQE